MLARKVINDRVEEIIRDHWLDEMSYGDGLCRRLALIKDLKALMDETVESALQEGLRGNVT